MITALDIPCPDCHMRKGIWCVYIEPTAPVGTKAWIRQNDRAGLPTKRLHNGRHNRAYWMEREAQRKARQEEYAARNAASPDREAILRANADAVAEEQRQLIAWLRQHASILEGAS